MGGRWREACSEGRRAAMLALALCLSGWSAAQETNGCGTGWNRYLIPDKLKIIGCNFRPACDAHDVCYGRCFGFTLGSSPPQCEYLRCERGGDLAGQSACDSVAFRENRLAAQERRVLCDAAFMVDISRTNPGNARCDLFSGLYPFAVRVLGAKNFLGMEPPDRVTMSQADQQRYASAINELMAKWPSDRLADLARQIREGTSGVDLTKPIEFDAQSGLRNRPASKQ